MLQSEPSTTANLALLLPSNYKYTPPSSGVFVFTSQGKEYGWTYTVPRITTVHDLRSWRYEVDIWKQIFSTERHSRSDYRFLTHQAGHPILVVGQLAFHLYEDENSIFVSCSQEEKGLKVDRCYYHEICAWLSRLQEEVSTATFGHLEEEKCKKHANHMLGESLNRIDPWCAFCGQGYEEEASFCTHCGVRRNKNGS